MKNPIYSLLVLIVLSSLVASCATGGYWIPPSSPSTQVAGAAPLPVTPTEQEAFTPTPDLAATIAAPPVIPVEASIVQTDPATPTETSLPPTPVLSNDPPVFPTATATPPVSPPDNTPILYYAQAADTLPVVAVRFGVQPEEITSPEPIPQAAYINPGQLLVIPRRLGNTTSTQHIIPDSEVVFSPSAANFDIDSFVQQAGGKMASYQQWLKTPGMLSGARLLLRVAQENSINPRLLLSLLEYQSGWVYGQPATQTQTDYPLGYVDPNEKGFYRQLVWAVNQLSIGYYAYREGRLTEINFPDGVTARLAPDLNAGTAALQYYFAQIYQGQQWLDALNVETGFPALHARMFGNPWERAMAVEPLFPPELTQPALTLPFARDWTWALTGGPHGAWEHDGAYAALDFAPGTTPGNRGCVESQAWVTAMSSGLVVRSETGVVVLDLDGDGSEQTGWVIIYLHVSSDKRVPVGSWVDTGDPLGHPSCEGGVSTGTHLHIARKYNGEWLPAGGPIPFDLGGWVAQAGPAAYKGTLTRGDQTITACTCSNYKTFITRTAQDP